MSAAPRSLPVKALCSPRDERWGSPEPPLLLSVSAARGVIPRSEVTDAEARADDLSIYKRVRGGDVVINRMSAYQGALGLASQPGVVSPDYLVLEVIRSVDPAWLSYAFRSTWFVAEMAARVRGIGSMDQGNVRTPRINWEDLSRIELSVPSTRQQRAIANYLDAETKRIDAMVGILRSLAALHTERLLAALAQALDDEPRHRLATVLTSIEQGWSPSAADFQRDDAATWAVLKLSAVTGGAYGPHHHKVLNEPPGANVKYEVRPGDLLMTRANTPDLVGDAVFVASTPRGLLMPDLVYRLRYRLDRADGQYLAFALRTPEVRNQISAIARGSSQSMVKLRGEDIKALTLPLPAKVRQRQLAARFLVDAQRAERVQAAMRQQTELLLERRQALITAAVTGQLEVPGVAA